MKKVLMIGMVLLIIFLAAGPAPPGVDTIEGILTLEYLLGHPLFTSLLHLSITVTTIHQIIMIRVIEFGSQVTGITGRPLTVGKESGFRVTGNLDMIPNGSR